MEKRVPGVNGLGAYGRWVFDQFDSVYETDGEFRELVERTLAVSKERRVA